MELPSWSQGDRLRARRRQLRLTIIELAAAADLDKATIVNAEADRPVQLGTLQKLAGALDAPADWLRHGLPD